MPAHGAAEGALVYEPSCSNAGCPSTDVALRAKATAHAKAASVTVLVLGTDLSVAREGHDAVDLTFSSGQVPAACLPWACHVPAMHVTAI